MTSLFSRRLMAWLLALAVIAGASPVMAASHAGDVTSLTNSTHSLPQTPSQAVLDELFSAAVEDEGGRRLADGADGKDFPAIVAAVMAVAPFGARPEAAADYRTRPTAEVRSSCHKTGPPTA
jgi:hypothetical protein